MKVAVLYDAWEDEAAQVEPEPKPEKPRRKPKKKKKEKHDREEIFEALGKLGHEPFYQVLDGKNQSLTALSRAEADLTFNLTESYAGDDTKDMNIAAYLDLLERPYTGAGWIVALCGDMQTMPGLGAKPAAYAIDVDEHGNIVGLF